MNTVNTRKVLAPVLLVFAVSVFVLATPVHAQTATAGIDLSGAEYTWENFPNTSDLDYLKSKGITLIRLPISWEKFQPVLNGPLDANQVAGIETFIDAAAARGMQVIVDLHNYARYDSAWVENSAWNIWTNGSIASPLTFPATGTYTFAIEAYGSPVAGVWPNMQFLIDGTVVGSTTVGSASYVQYPFTTTVTAGTHTIAVAFTNDASTATEDRNLYVAKINITGPSFSTVLEADNMPTKTTGAPIAYLYEGDTSDASTIFTIGTTQVPISAYQDFWTKLAGDLHGYAGLSGYDIMNEPNTLPNLNIWASAAQAAVNGIRSVDTSTTIYVEGNGWSIAQNWVTNNPNFPITDPANNLVYEAHQYFDNGSGTYTQTYDQYDDTPTTGSNEVQPFLTWLKQNNAKGYVGEYGVPDNDPRWLVLMSNFLSTLQANNVSSTAWAYGFHNPGDPSWWHVHGILSLDPSDNNGVDEPQIAIITEYAQGSTSTATPTPAIADTTPPSVPGSLTASAVSSTQINLTWAASIDNVGVVGYKVFRNGTQVGTPTATSYSDTGLAASTQYSYTVSAYDAAGNTSAASAAVSATTVPAPASFSIGDRVQTTASLNVRSSASTAGTLLGTEASGALGTVVGGPTTANGYVWWNVNFDNGTSGWSVQDYLVKVAPIPTLTLTASPTSITSGSSATLTWSSTNATSCTGTNFTASGTSGSVSVTPTATITYTLTCTGAGGSASQSATVTVTPAPTPTPTPAPAPAPSPSASGTTIPSATQLVDGQGNIWTVSSGVIYENAALAGYSANVNLLLYYNGVIYQENSAGGWWSWTNATWLTLTGDPRVSAAPTPTPTPSPIPAPTPAPSTNKFTIGERVETTSTVNVRVVPSITVKKAGTAQKKGKIGTVVAGPTVASGYTWWDINFDTGTDGWVVQNYLIQAPVAASNLSQSIAQLQDELNSILAQINALNVKLEAAVEAAGQ